ncbi:MAG: hypothetical protein QXW97_03915 [Candidatus Pacearchaeota archaeon]
MNETRKIESFVREKKIKEEGNWVIAIIVGMLLFFISLIIIFGFNLPINQIIIFILIILAFYIVVLSFLFEPKLIKEIINTFIRIEEKPTISKEFSNKSSDKVRTIPIIYEVPKPVIKEVIKTVDRPVIINKNTKKLNIPKYDYIGSSETRTFHRRSCRLSKLIKRKYKLSSNNINFFLKKGFSPCKVCIRKTKKI